MCVFVYELFFNTMLANKRFYLLLGITFLLGLYYLSSLSGSSLIPSQRWPSLLTGGYKSNCLAVYKKLRFPDPSLFYNPPLKEPPPEMLDEFTQNGLMPIKKYWYFNEIYSDSKGEEKKKRVISKTEMDNLLTRVRNNEPLNYGDQVRLLAFRLFS